MNFLAHQYLSGSDQGLRLGNFIGDMVKGSKWKAFPKHIQKGVLLHRSIDDFTDHHPTVKSSAKLLHPYLGRYSAIATDIFFDHFLAKHWEDFSAITLHQFAQETYSLVDENISILPDKTAYMLGFMKNQDWLYNYQFITGIEKTMKGMSRRTEQHMLENSHEFLLKHYDEFHQNFFSFFPDLQKHVSKFIYEFSETEHV
jgi:acyl carrier protein phosphodiesterase